MTHGSRLKLDQAVKRYVLAARSDRGRIVDRGVIPQRPLHEAPGSRRTRSTPERRASGGHDMGSTAIEAAPSGAGLEGVAGEDHDVAEALVHPHRDSPAPGRVVELDAGHPVGVTTEVGEGGVEDGVADPARAR